MIALGACPAGLSGAPQDGAVPMSVSAFGAARPPRSRPRGGRGRGNRRARANCPVEWRGKCLQSAVAEL
eukprot:1159564-Pyramimonas_sp.AAC.1